MSPQCFHGIHELMQFTGYLLCVCFTLLGWISERSGETTIPSRGNWISLCGTVGVGGGGLQWEKCAGDCIQRTGLGSRFKARDHIIVIA